MSEPVFDEVRSWHTRADPLLSLSVAQPASPVPGVRIAECGPWWPWKLGPRPAALKQIELQIHQNRLS